MKLLKLIAAGLLITSCGLPSDHEETDNRAANYVCTVEQHDSGATITCPDGSTAEVSNGVNGENGVNGRNGRNGFDGRDGVDGSDGADLTQPIYLGHFCGRTALLIGGTKYLMNSSLTPLTNSWTKVSNNCKVRINKGKIEEKKS